MEHPKSFNEIPLALPVTPLLDDIDVPEDLRKMERKQLVQVSNELREYLLYSVGKSGGHFGAGLGVVELTVALHYLYNTPDDRIIWDVGHQAYPHKILTGRKKEILNIRHRGGLAGFPRRNESEYDTFGVGHSSTSISAGLGISIATEMDDVQNKRQFNKSRNMDSDDSFKPSRRVVAVIGDGAMTGGMAFEAMNHAAHTRSNILVILNDNSMSISNNVGGLANYFARIWASRLYISIREGGKKAVSSMPKAWDFLRRTEESMKVLVSPDSLFESIGFNYIGPMDGHNMEELLHTIENMRDLEGPQLLHVITKKGKGFVPAEKDPVGYHAINKIDPVPAVQDQEAKKNVAPKFSAVFGEWLCDMAEIDERLVGITPAMSDGSGMVEFSECFPDRFHDVAIAEQHAVTFAAGMACEGKKPVVAIYSTFLQRAYDQLVHDVAVQNLDVTFAIDRAGLVGADGPTHAGSFDFGYMRCLPNVIIMAPADENECRQMLYTGYEFNGPAAIRYPRGEGSGVKIINEMAALEIGKGRLIREGNSRIAILSFGTLLPVAIEAAEKLDATVADMRFVKPLDEALITKLAGSADLLVTLEDHSIMTGAGSAVNETLQQLCIPISVLNLGLPDYFVEHGSQKEMLTECGLDAEGVLKSVNNRIKLLSRPEASNE